MLFLGATQVRHENMHVPQLALNVAHNRSDSLLELPMGNH